jgi:hypothetical protein
MQLLTSIGSCNLEGLRIRGCPRVTKEGLGQLVRSCTSSVTQVGGRLGLRGSAWVRACEGIVEKLRGQVLDFLRVQQKRLGVRVWGLRV